MLTPRLIRLEWSADGSFEDRSTFAFPNRHFDPPRFALSDTPSLLTIDTGALQIRYTPDSGPFSAENLLITLDVSGTPVTWRPGDPNPGNLRGTRRTLDGAAGPVALSEGILSRDGWALYDDSMGVVFTESGKWVAPRPDHDFQDWYFFGYGRAYTDAIAEYTQFGGKIPLIPRFVLGAWWSRYWAYSAEDLQQLVADFAAHDLPLDVLVLDMDWHTPDSWTGYTWNRELFPDPEGFLRWAHDQGLHVTLNLHPAEGVQAFEEIYPKFAEALGVDPASEEPVAFRPGNPEFMRHYFEMLHHPLEDQGVDFWWLDWQQGESSDIKGLDPLPWLNHLHFLDSARRGRRPMLYSRWGGLGNHRYYIGFSGDTYSAWPSLQFQPYFTATASNVLYGWWSHDIGGHFGKPEPELYARWVQYGALSPCLRLHSTKDAQSERRPWAFSSEVLEAARAAFHLRYQLVPYLYTMARIATGTGISLCRPLYYSYPEAEAAYLARDTYLLGDQLLAAPIVRPANPATGLASADVWVPPGTWFDYQSGESFTGPRWVRLVGDLNRVPLLAKEGTILPLAPLALNTAAAPADELIIEVFPGKEGSFRLYEDDGATPAYGQGQYEWTPITMQTESETHCRVQIGPAEGRCDALPPTRRYELHLRGTSQPERVLVGGVDSPDWTHDADKRLTVVRIPLHDRREPVAVTVIAGESVWADTERHNRARILDDVRRLLGSAFRDAPLESLPSAIGALDHPGRADALARLGGPFVQVLEHVTLPEASSHLGGLIVASPSDGTPFDLSVTWTLHGGGEPEKHTQNLKNVREDQVLWSPFAYTGQEEPLAWDLNVTVTGAAGEVTHHHTSTTLCLSVPVWSVEIHDEKDRPWAIDDAPGKEDSPTITHRPPSMVYRRPTAMPSLTDPYRVELREMYQRVKETGTPLRAQATTTIVSADERDVRIAYGDLGDGGCWLNGERIGEMESGTEPPLRLPSPLAWKTRVTVPVRLRAGANTLVLNLAPAPDAREWEYTVVAAVLNPDGSVATGIRYEESQKSEL
jgi:alpha-glucosidase